MIYFKEPIPLSAILFLSSDAKSQLEDNRNTCYKTKDCSIPSQSKRGRRAELKIEKKWRSSSTVTDSNFAYVASEIIFSYLSAIYYGKKMRLWVFIIFIRNHRMNFTRFSVSLILFCHLFVISNVKAFKNLKT